MRKTILLGCILAWLVRGADADILKMRMGGDLRGTVQTVTILVKDVQTIYPRDEVVAVRLSKDGNDVLEVRSEATLEGKVVSVMFDSPGGLRAVPRDKLESITLDNATTVETLKSAEKTEEEQKEEEKSQLTDEQKQALLKNREFAKGYAETAEQMKDDAYEAVRTKYMDRVRQAVNDLKRLERSILNKIQRREEASTRTGGTSVSGSSGRQQMSERERLERYDNLAQDQRDYEVAKAAASKLKATIRADEKKVKEKFEERMARINAVYAEHRKKILAGEILKDEDMTARYDVAIRLPGEKPIKTVIRTVKTPAAPKPASQAQQEVGEFLKGE